MANVKFYDKIDEEKSEFAVVISKMNGKWVLCKHKDRTTLEFPGGHREVGESILETAKRELQEETGAEDYLIKQLCVYSVHGKTRRGEVLKKKVFGALFIAEIKSLKNELHNEIEKVFIMDDLPTNWTYPEIMPKLIQKVQSKV